MFGEMGEDDHQTMHGVRGVRLSDVLLIRGLGKWKLKTMKTINFESGFCESRKGDGGHLSSLAFYAREQITPIPFTTEGALILFFSKSHVVQAFKGAQLTCN